MQQGNREMVGLAIYLFNFGEACVYNSTRLITHKLKLETQMAIGQSSKIGNQVPPRL